MSLLNDMLRDLKKIKPYATTFTISPTDPTAWRHPSPWIQYLVGTLLLFIVASLMFFYFFLPKNSHLSPKPQMPIQEQQELQPPVTHVITNSPDLTNNTSQHIVIPMALQTQDHAARPTPRGLTAGSSDFARSVDPAVKPLDVESGRLVTLNDNSSEIPESLGSFVRENSVLSPIEIQEKQFALAEEAISQGNIELAQEQLGALLIQYPKSIPTRLRLAEIYMSTANYAAAADILDEGLVYQPQNMQMILYKAEIFSQQGLYPKALALMEQLTPDVNVHPEYYATLAAIYEAMGRTNEAGSLYQSLIKLDPHNGQYWLGYAIALENKQSLHQAISAYKQASQCENMNPAVRSYAENRLKILQG